MAIGAPSPRDDLDTVETEDAPIRFDRLPPAELYDPGFLQTLVGDYDLGGAVCEVRLRGAATLTVTVPGQPTYVLEPYRRTEFNLSGVTIVGGIWSLGDGSLTFSNQSSNRLDGVTL